jgi:hypothetical protein
MINFEQAIRTEFATMHIMNEKGYRGPVDMFLQKGYELQIDDPAKWEAIQKNYEPEIRKVLDAGVGDRKSFVYKPWRMPHDV